VTILAQLSADFALTHNFQGTHILGASRGHLCDSSAFLLSMLLYWRQFITDQIGWEPAEEWDSQQGPSFS